MYFNHSFYFFCEQGYDTEKIVKDTEEKIDYIVSALKFEGVLKMLNEKFYNKNKSSGVSIK